MQITKKKYIFPNLDQFKPIFDVIFYFNTQELDFRDIFDQIWGTFLPRDEKHDYRPFLYGFNANHNEATYFQILFQMP